jgi:SAM-dependent methyltransferase
MNNFFDSYSDFASEQFDQCNPMTFESTDTRHSLARLNKRHIAVMQTMPHLFQDANVLDIACANCRWSFAAIKSGAKYVTGIEPRQTSLTNGINLLEKYNIDKNSYEFLNADAFTTLPNLNKNYDVVLLMGFLAHVYDQPKLMSLISKLSPKYLIVDSGFSSKKGMLCTITKVKSADGFIYPNETSVNDYTYGAVPSLPFIKDMIDFYGFDIAKEVDWQNIVTDHGSLGIEDYASGNRVTFICKKR